MNQRRHSRRRFLQTAGTGLAAAALPSWLIKCRTAEKPPNILFIVIDDLNDWANCLGSCPGVHTPNLGRLLDTFESSRYGRNTIIVLWSDHGMHIGEKEHWEKFTLWEESTRVPLIFVAPGLTRPGSVCDQPVSLLDVYPTLVDLAGHTPRPGQPGASPKRSITRYRQSCSKHLRFQ